MQPPFSCTPVTLQRVEGALSEARLGRYLKDTGKDKHFALRLYIWNVRMCESFYLPTQICEVALRNAIHKALRGKHGENWHERGSFLCTLPERLKNELHDVCREERAAYGRAMTIDHIVSGLSFGFWIHLLTKNYEDVFWPTYFEQCFPNKPKAIGRQAIYDRADKFRVHRNRIAHHKPIYDRTPNAEYQNILELISWVCEETHWFVKYVSGVSRCISERPRY